MGLKVSNKNRKEQNKNKIELVFPACLPQEKESDNFLVWSTGLIIFLVVLFII